MDRMLATWFGAGLLRPAPGTWGSAVAVAMGLILHRIGHFPLLALATGLVILLGFWVVPRYTAGMDDPDRSEIVIDEVAGQWLALMAPSFGFWHAGFDIWKPWLVGRADRRHDSAGVMLDDLWAGIFAALATMAAAAFAHTVLM